MKSGRSRDKLGRFGREKQQHNQAFQAANANHYSSFTSRLQPSLLSLRDKVQTKRRRHPKNIRTDHNNANINTTSSRMYHNYNYNYNYDEFDDEEISEVPPMRSHSANQVYHYHQSQSAILPFVESRPRPLEEILRDLELWMWKEDERDDMNIFMDYHELLTLDPIYERSEGKKVLMMPMFDPHKRELKKGEWVHIVNDKCSGDDCNEDKMCHHRLICELIKRGNMSNLLFIVKFAFPTIFDAIMPSKSENLTRFLI